MSQLEPCPHCQRHVRIDTSSCPFCSAALDGAFAQVQPRKLPRTRLGRAALFAFGVGAAAAVLPACEDDDDDDEDSGNVVPVYGAPTADAGDSGSGKTPDGGTPNNQPDSGGVVALYGAAPTD